MALSVLLSICKDRALYATWLSVQSASQWSFFHTFTRNYLYLSLCLWPLVGLRCLCFQPPGIYYTLIISLSSLGWRAFPGKLLLGWLAPILHWCLAYSSQVQDFVFPLAELSEILHGPFRQPIEVPLSGSMAIWSISFSSRFCIVFEPAGGAFCPIISEDTELYWPQYWPLGYTTSNWPPAGLHAAGHKPGITASAVYLAVHLSSPCLTVFLSEDAMGYSAESLPEVKIREIDWLFIHQAISFIKLVRRVFSFHKSMLSTLNYCLGLICLEVVSRVICFIKVRLTHL